MNNLREKIIETNFYLTQELLVKKREAEVERLRAELNNLIDLYLKEIRK